MVPVSFGTTELLLRSDRAVYWPRERTLFVADLHLEKASFFASHGQPLPPPNASSGSTDGPRLHAKFVYDGLDRHGAHYWGAQQDCPKTGNSTAQGQGLSPACASPIHLKASGSASSVGRCASATY